MASALAVEHRQASPTVVAVDPDADAGRGLHIVAALALRRGVDAIEPIGKTVWFEVAAVAA